MDAAPTAAPPAAGVGVGVAEADNLAPVPPFAAFAASSSFLFLLFFLCTTPTLGHNTRITRWFDELHLSILTFLLLPTSQ